MKRTPAPRGTSRPALARSRTAEPVEPRPPALPKNPQELLATLLTNLSEGIVVIDGRGRLTLVNPSAGTLIGHPVDDLVGRVIETLVLPFSALDLEQSNAHPQASLVRTWGQRVLEITLIPRFSRSRRRSGTLCLLRDQTERQRADRLQAESISLVSHELRAPLAAIKGYADLLITGDAGPLMPRQEEYLGIVRRSVDRLNDLITDLLDISRLEAGRIPLDLAPVALTPLVGELLRAFRAQLQLRLQTVYADLPKGDVVVLADRDRLLQILWNLLSNAHKYTPPEGYIHLLVEAAIADTQIASNPDLIARRAPLLIISVEDNGIGIDPRDQDKLFDKFYRVQTPYTRTVGGTGLGLAIAKGLVEMHGGRIWVSSPIDPVTLRGSRFSFSIPLAPPDA